MHNVLNYYRYRMYFFSKDFINLFTEFIYEDINMRILGGNQVKNYFYFKEKQ